MATPPLPPGFEFEDEVTPKRKVSFDLVGYVPPEVKDAAEQASSHLDNATPAIPEGFEPMGPGMGQSVPDPLKERAQQDAMIRSGMPDPFAAVINGRAPGVLAPVDGAGQLMAHATPGGAGAERRAGPRAPPGVRGGWGGATRRVGGVQRGAPSPVSGSARVRRRSRRTSSPRRRSSSPASRSSWPAEWPSNPRRLSRSRSQ